MSDAATTVPLALVYRRADGRQVNMSAVGRIAESISEIGLKTPITVRKCQRIRDGRPTDAYEIVAGQHRAEACRKLGWTEVAAIVSPDEDREARLWEISENLHRAELTVQERADHIDEWRKLTAQKVCQVGTPSGGKQPDEVGVRKTAAALGIANAEVVRSKKIAAISEEAKEAARAAGFDNNQTALLEIADAKEPSAQVDKVAELKKRRDGRKALAKAGDDIVKADGLAAAAQTILDFMHHERIDQLMSHLDAAGLGKLSAAIRRGRATRGERTEADRPVFDASNAGRAA